MTEVLITLPAEKSQLDSLRAVSSRLKVTVRPAQKVTDIPEDLWARIEVLYTDKVLPAPEQAPLLTWVQLHWAGIDGLLGAPVLQKPGLTVTTMSGIHAPQMGEYILLMMLALGHQLPGLMEDQRKANWKRDRWEAFSPVELRGATVGIVGYGSIGRQVARLGRAFDMRVLATKRNAMQPADDEYILEGTGDPQGDFVHRLYPAQALKSMLAECDFVVVAVPLTDETRGLIGPEELAAMKSSAYLIDVSRGGVIDHAALLPALKNKKISGAALDVFPEEPLPGDSPLWSLKNVILTPHIAGITPHYAQRAMDLFRENLRRYVNGKPLLNQFDFDKGY